MNTYEDYGDEELNNYIIQLSIQDSCQDVFLKSAARYPHLEPPDTEYVMTAPLTLCLFPA